MVVVSVIFTAAYFTFILRPFFGAHDPVSVLSIALLVSVPVLWFWGLRTRRVAVCLILVPIGLIMGAGQYGVTDAAPGTSTLQVSVLILYVFATGQDLSRLDTVCDTVEPEWIQTVPQTSDGSIWPGGFIALATVCGVFFILGWPEALVPDGHRWVAYRPRIQVVTLLAVGIHSMVMVNRLGQPRMSWASISPRVLAWCIGLGLGLGALMEWFG